MLLNETGVEVATRTRLNFNHDMRSTGIGNIIAGLGGGLAGYPLLGLTVLNYRIGVSTRFVGLLTALLTLFVLFYGAGLLAIFPRWVVAGILFYLAFDFLFDWLVDSRHTCSFLEYLLILVIMTGIVTLGILEGIALGVVIMTMVFVFNYSRIEVIKNEQTGTHRRSNVQRASPLEKYLSERGQNTLILELQGYLFFGTTNRILERVAKIFSSPGAPGPEYIVLDFRRVYGVDSSSILSFLNLSYLAEKQSTVLVFTGLDARLEEQLKRGGCLSNGTVCVHKSDLDRGIEWCENQILDRRNVFLEAFNLRESLENEFGSDQYVKLERYLEKCEYSAGSIVFKQGEASDGLYFIESGAVSIILNEGTVAPVRLRKLGEGTLFGEMSVYTQEVRSASAQVDNDAVIYFLSIASMNQIEREAPDLASTFHRFVVNTLSHRLEHSNSALFAMRH
jgi:SulP family sulfate permease